MTEASLDPRLNAFRPDIADARLKGKVDAARFAEGSLRRVVASAAPLKSLPRSDAPLASELIRGEVFRTFETNDEGWAWGQSETDGYVGHVPADALADLSPVPTHRIDALRTFIYPGADMKLPAGAALSLGARIAIDGEAETRGTRYWRLANGEGAIVARHAASLDSPPAPDFVAVAERFIGTAYLWGGRTSLGLDCSALVQISMMAAGRSVLRDTDMQLATIGKAVDGTSGLRRGDLLFWPGHVAIVADGDTIVHASGFHMAVVREVLREALARIGPPSVRRP